MKCRFYRECTREYSKELTKYVKERQRQGHPTCIFSIRGDYFVGSKLED